MNVYQVIAEKKQKSENRQVALYLPEKYAGFLASLGPSDRRDYVIGLIDADLLKNGVTLSLTGVPISVNQTELPILDEPVPDSKNNKK